ncbi:prokaryotic phospholipase A2-domain-containing protein [Sordaria brevicollis]|uniref:Prokaryotic phospholipase A2-domain-containing protein n=1 Tax=Sordaria brevicollis TaxID=83679 RepID=A0AAE0U2P1_SORBR|nr:prokaryotic phospholipase A2-domain-containing protein [Sordaria brevicollis]
MNLFSLFFFLLAVASNFLPTTTTALPNPPPLSLSPRSSQATTQSHNLTPRDTLNTTTTTTTTTTQTLPADTVRTWCKYTHGMLFLWDLPTFIRHREAQFSLGQMTWDWDSDGCSHVPTDRPMGIPFLPACQRHDFGYRNFQAQHHFTEGARHKIDDNFSKDMYYQCKTYGHNWFDKSFCKATAWAYWWAVRAFYNGKGKIQHWMDAVAWAESMSEVYAEMDPDEARDAANPNLPQEKMEEYYQRAMARAERAEKVARAMGGPNFYPKE